MTVIEVTTDTCDHCGPSTKAYLYLPALLEQGATIIDQRHLIGQP